MDQQGLLEIVRTWRPKPEPEYQGFRCANCQRSLHASWHHWLENGGYNAPVHLCRSCEKRAQQGKLKVRGTKRPVSRSRFYSNFSAKIMHTLRKVARSLRPSETPRYKSFTCDQCRTSLYKAWHVWSFLDGSLTELHFCKRCSDKLFSV